jgi:methionyl-tRNA synthetase
MDNKFYITTTLPYVNAEPHIGFALEIIQADVVARYQRSLGKEVVFNFGTDEHGKKIFEKAIEQKKDVKLYCDEYAVKFDNLKKALNLSYTNFIRTTDEHHVKAAQEFWRRCVKNGDIYKKLYKTKYCVGCELEKTDSELVDNKCPLHPNRELEIIEEENYFFRFSKYQKPLLEFYEKNPDFVLPVGKFNEIKTFVAGGLEDFSVSRLKAKMPWGIDVPDDSEHILFVWFDALINYISTLGWPENEENYKNFWPGIQVAGKDNLRQQTAIWQAMLMSAGLPNSKQVFIHGFLTVDGQKISKSLGNAINPIELVEKYGTDPVRYFLLAHIHPWDDSDFSVSKLEEAYNSDLANGIGNLVSRVVGMIEKYCDGKIPQIETDADSHPLRTDENIHNWKKVWKDIDKFTPVFQFDQALGSVWKFIKEADRYIDENKPWELSKTDMKKLNWVLYGLVDSLHQVAWQIYPFLPETAVKIGKILGVEALTVNNPNSKDSWTNLPPGRSIHIDKPLFPRI